MNSPQDDPLDFVDLSAILQYGSPDTWKYVGKKPGSPVSANSPKALPGTMKHYDIYEDDSGVEFELHFFRHPDGTVGDVKAKPRSP